MVDEEKEEEQGLGGLWLLWFFCRHSMQSRFLFLVTTRKHVVVIVVSTLKHSSFIDDAIANPFVGSFNSAHFASFLFSHTNKAEAFRNNFFFL